jgi:hypothetical protein
MPICIPKLEDGSLNWSISQKIWFMFRDWFYKSLLFNKSNVFLNYLRNIITIDESWWPILSSSHGTNQWEWILLYQEIQYLKWWTSLTCIVQRKFFLIIDFLERIRILLDQEFQNKWCFFFTCYDDWWGWVIHPTNLHQSSNLLSICFEFVYNIFSINRYSKNSLNTWATLTEIHILCRVPTGNTGSVTLAARQTPPSDKITTCLQQCSEWI